MSETGIVAPGSVLFPSTNAPKEPALTQAEVNYTEKTPDQMQHCSICRHFLGAGACELVKPEPKSIMDQGWCDHYADVQVDEMSTQPEAVVKEQAMENKGFIYLPIRWVWEIERIQGALYTLFGYDLDWNFYSSYTYHITLAYCGDVTDEQLMEAAKAVVGMNVVSIKFSGWGTFPAENDKKTLYLKTEENADLRALQRAVYDSLVAQGVTVSEAHTPDAYVPHMSIALVPADAVVPEAAIDIDAYCHEVVLGRDNYSTLATVNLKWNESSDLNPDEGMSPALESAKLAFGAHPDYEVIRGEEAWDAQSAVNAALESINYGKPGQNANALPLIGSMFLVRDSAAPSLMTSYRHPFAELKEGKLVITAESLRSAAESLAKDKDLPEVAVEAALAELNRYKGKVGVGEMSKIRMTMVSEMKGEYPSIELPEGIDLVALEEIAGRKPVFVTLPIGQAGARSNNNRTYSRAAVEQMVEQINDQRPYGGWGHMTEEELATDFDPPAVQWLAATMDENGVAWGKFIALNKETGDYYLTAKALGSKVATSLVAFAEMVRDTVISLELKLIDIADPARIGVPMTVAAPLIANEMAGDVFVKTRTTTQKNEAQKPADQQRVQEQIQQVPESADSEAEGTSVPDAVSQESVERVNEMQLTQEQIQALVASEGALKAQVTELTAKLEAAEAANKQWEETDKPTLVGELNVLLGEYAVAEIDREVQVASFRGMVKKQVLKGKPQSRDAIKAAVKEFLDDPDNQEAMKVAVTTEMGNRQTTANTSLHTREQAETSGSKTPGSMENFEFDPIDPSPRPTRQMQEA